MKKSYRSSKKTLRKIATLTLGLAGAALAGCSGAANGGTFSSEQSSTTVDQSAGFQITATYGGNGNVQSYMHAFGAFNSTCSIDPSAAPTDLKCMVEARETDVYANPLSIGINVPAGMCTYFEQIPYFYYNYQPGYGAATYTMTVRDGVVTSCKINNTNIVPGSDGTCQSSTGTIDDTGTVTCPFDFSGDSPAGPNCCLGNYVSTVTTITSATTPGDSDTTTTTSTNGAYGGTPGSCIAGPGQSTLWPNHVTSGPYTGFPGAVLSSVSTTGFAATLSNRTPITYVEGNNDTISASNFYFDWPSYLSQGNSVATTPPPAIVPSLLPGGVSSDGSSSILSTSDSWQFLCENEAHEVIHRIRLYVNEWDTDENFAAYVASNGTSTAPPNALDTDRDGVNCTVGGSIQYGYCNDFFSLRDYATGTYGSGRGSAIGYFPRDAINDSADPTAPATN